MIRAYPRIEQKSLTDGANRDLVLRTCDAAFFKATLALGHKKTQSGLRDRTNFDAATSFGALEG